MAAEQVLVGNRIVLIGAVVYLLEWAAIIPVSIAGDFGPVDPGTKTPQELVSLYAESARGVAFLASWLSLVLLGRIAIVGGIRSALRESSGPKPLTDVAVAAMAVSVAIEVTGFSVVAAAGLLAARGADASVIVGLDGVAGWMYLMVFAPLGASVLLAALSMLWSRLVPGWICWLGVVAGALVMVHGLLIGLAHGETGFLRTAADATGLGMPGFWLWMLATGVFFFRKAPHLEGAGATAQ